MAIQVKFFAVLKDEMGMSEAVIDECVATCEGVLRFFGPRFPGLQPIFDQCQFAVNGEWVDRKAPVNEGDEVALLPPVSGG